MVTIAGKINQQRSAGFDGFLPLRLGQMEDVELQTIGHEVALHVARGTDRRNRLRCPVLLSLLAARSGGNPLRVRVRTLV